MSDSPRMVYQQGDHVCTLYSTPEEQLQAALEYIRGGLARGERCLYVVCEHESDEFREALRRGGIDVDAEEKRGALLLLTKHDGHLKGGTFDPDRMISMLTTAVNDALSAGFAGLCAAGDMSWLLTRRPGRKRSPTMRRDLIVSIAITVRWASVFTTGPSYLRRRWTMASRRIRISASKVPSCSQTRFTKIRKKLRSALPSQKSSRLIYGTSIRSVSRSV